MSSSISITDATSAYLTTLTRLDSSLSLTQSASKDHHIIFRRHEAHEKIILIAAPPPSPWSSTALAQFVGKGALTAAIVSVTDGALTPSSSLSTELVDEVSRLCRGVTVVDEEKDVDDSPAVLIIQSNPRSKGQESEVIDEVAVLTVCDDASIGRSELENPGVGRAGGAGTVLLLKICGALVQMGYELPIVRRVGGLVARNLVSVDVVIGHEGDDDDNDELVKLDEVEIDIFDKDGQFDQEILKQLVSQTLQTMLDQNDKDRAFVHVNSNEVVLLVNNLGGLSNDELQKVTTEALGQIQSKWNIWPVRVYTNHFLSTENTRGFSLTVLNVVNTDIGGPSMIQLLDEFSNVQRWNALVRKERWDGHRWLGREDWNVSASIPWLYGSHFDEKDSKDVIEMEPEYHETSMTPEEAEQKGDYFEDSFESMTLEKAASEAQSQSHQRQMEEIFVPDPELVTEPANKGVESQAETDSVRTQTDEEEIPPTWTTEDLPQRPDIQHPTFRHSDTDETLLDLVRRHAKKHIVPTSDEGLDATSAEIPDKTESAVGESDSGPSEECEPTVAGAENRYKTDESLMDMIRRQSLKLGVASPEKATEKSETTPVPESQKSHLSDDEDYEVVEEVDES